MAAGPAPEPPPPLLTAAKLMYAGAVITVLSILVTFTQGDAMRDAVRDADNSLTESEVDSVVAAGMVFTVVFGLIAVGLWIWMATVNRQGKSWARVTATVLGGLSIVFTLLGLGQDTATGVSTLFSLVNVVLAAVILYLLWRPESSRYYAAMSPR